MTFDSNANLGKWPFKHLDLDSPFNLEKKFKALGITKSLVGNLEGLFHNDIGGVNQRLVDWCANIKEVHFLPSGSINPTLTGWQRDLDNCKTKFHMRSIRLHPNYHGYDLQDPRFFMLLEKAASGGLLVQIVLRMEDERTQHPLLRIQPVDLKPLVEAIAKVPGAKVQLLNTNQDILSQTSMALARSKRVFFDIASLEGTQSLPKVIRSLGIHALCLGTHAPLFVPESALLKIHEGNLPKEEENLIRFGNMEQILSAS